MARRVVLHVGSMKSGTSYLQSLLMTNRELLSERGVRLPGRIWRDQVSGVSEVIGFARLARTPPAGAWQALVDDLAQWPGTGVISMEFLGPIGLPKIERVVSSFPDDTVEVIVTARDLNRQVPAMWQEMVKNGRSFSFADYVEHVRTNEGPGEDFWRQQTIAAMCKRWSELVGVDRVTLVTVPHPGADRSELWRRFAQAMDVDGTGLAGPKRRNESLGAASMEVLRRLNAELDDLTYSQYAPVGKHLLGQAVLPLRRLQEPAVGFDVPEWLPPLARQMVERVRDLGVRVIGDLDDLTPIAVPGIDPGTVSAEDQLAAAAAGMEGLFRALVERG